MKRLTALPAEASTGNAAFATTGAGSAQVEGPLGDAGAGEALLGAGGQPLQLAGGAKYENIMDAARQLVDDDPKRVAQLVKTWVNEDAG
jgi:flagellar M-ring protein FliF